jgi:hypothetical protein
VQNGLTLRFVELRSHFSLEFTAAAGGGAGVVIAGGGAGVVSASRELGVGAVVIMLQWVVEFGIWMYPSRHWQVIIAVDPAVTDMH